MGKTYQSPHYRLALKTVTIPAAANHDGFSAIRVTLKWRCPICDQPRGEIFETRSYDGSRVLFVDGWRNACGHIDKYDAVRAEAAANPYNTQPSDQDTNDSDDYGYADQKNFD